MFFDELIFITVRRLNPEVIDTAVSKLPKFSFVKLSPISLINKVTIEDAVKVSMKNDIALDFKLITHFLGILWKVS
ncbi:hypothetical protein E4K63_05175 [Allofrancisella inopinata]|uniref:Uncharacterized protein n=1 Tax=Allofrancisella inopinata TaxID=1085647 RepID=A0AAE6YI15_9GAMM|nr:hypothetical protein [Allofrancisella inopinata]QIV96253.1 hypothetical protein E4K63_05175 [Allofrancisella inopinata]